MLIEPEVIRMLLFGFALVLMMLFRPGGDPAFRGAQARVGNESGDPAVSAAGSLLSATSIVEALRRRAGAR